MDKKTYDLIRNTLIEGGPVAYAAVQLKLHDYPTVLRHYLSAPLPLLSLSLGPLPKWLRSLVYVDRFDLVITEQQLGDPGPGAAPADTLLYLLSAAPEQLSQWDAMRGPAAFATLSRQGDWLTRDQKQQLRRLLDCEPLEATGSRWHSLQLLQIMLRQWLLRQSYTHLLIGDHAFEDGYFTLEPVDFSPGLSLRTTARRRFPDTPTIERRTHDAPTLTHSPATAPARATTA